MSVKRAVRQNQQAGPIEAPLGFQIKECFFDGAERNGSVHGILCEGISLDVEGIGAGKDRAIVVGFVAVAVHQNDVAGTEESLFDHFVGGGSSVGHEENMVGAKGASGFVLSHLNVASRL